MPPRHAPGTRVMSVANAGVARYSVTTETIEKDLTTEAPQWILSAYAPARNTPGQLFGGYPREQSFEEMRLHYLTAKASGNEQQAVSLFLDPEEREHG